MPQPLLQVSNLSIRLNTQPIVSDISFAIEGGAIAGLFGESGCGKATLALSLLKLLPPRQYRVQGRVLLDGADLLPLPERAWQRIRGARMAMVFQYPLLA